MSAYRTPVVYWLSAVTGLVVALLSDGWGDVLGLILLSAPIGRLLYSGLTWRTS